jgi:hypothetical protein
MSHENSLSLTQSTQNTEHGSSSLVHPSSDMFGSDNSHMTERSRRRRRLRPLLILPRLRICFYLNVQTTIVQFQCRSATYFSKEVQRIVLSYDLFHFHSALSHLSRAAAAHPPPLYHTTGVSLCRLNDTGLQFQCSPDSRSVFQRF